MDRCSRKQREHHFMKEYREGIMVERLTAYFRKWENMEAERKQEKGTEDGSKETEPVSGRL